MLRELSTCPELVRGWVRVAVIFCYSAHFPSPMLRGVCFQNRGVQSDAVSHQLRDTGSSGRTGGSWCPLLCGSPTGSLHTWSSLGTNYTSVELNWNPVVLGQSPWEPIVPPALDIPCLRHLDSGGPCLPGMCYGSGHWASNSHCLFIV